MHALKVATKNFITANLTLPDLKILCYNLQIDFEQLSGSSDIRIKALEMIEELNRNNRFFELLNQLTDEYPNRFVAALTLLEEIDVYILQLIDRENWEEVTVAVNLFNNFNAQNNALKDNFCSELKALVEKRLGKPSCAKFAWKNAERFLNQVKKVLPNLDCSLFEIDPYILKLIDGENWKEVTVAFNLFNKFNFNALKDNFCSELKALVEKRLGKPDCDPVAWTNAERFLNQVKEVLPNLDCSLFNPHTLSLSELAETHPRSLLREIGILKQNGKWDDVRKRYIIISEIYSECLKAKKDLKILNRWEKWYTEGCSLWNQQRYDDSETIFVNLTQKCKVYKDVSEKLEILEKCKKLALEGKALLADWKNLIGDKLDRAQASFSEINTLTPGYQEAPLHLRYVQAMHTIHNKEWSAAKQQLKKIQIEKPDYEGVNELLTTIKHLQDTINQLPSLFVRDPCLRWADDFPYDIFQVVGITPASSMEAVKGASFDLQELKCLLPSPGETRAYDNLRHVERRLFIDAFIYTIEQSDTVINFFETEMVTRHELPSIETLTEHFPQQSLAIMALWKKHRKLPELHEIQKNDPNNMGLAHQMGIFYLAWAEELSAQQKTESAIKIWKMAIAQWAILLESQEYWNKWGKQRANYYGQPVLPNHLETLLSKLEQELFRRLSG